jgi:hypothetical protein
MVVHGRRAVPRVITNLKGSLRTGGVRRPVTICDLSMAGARVRTVQPITFGHTTVLNVPGLPSLTACVRWSVGAEFGVSFQPSLSTQMVADLLSKVDQPIRAMEARELQLTGIDKIAKTSASGDICSCGDFGQRPRHLR